ncbi:DUF4260 domain-containing protein [Halorubrum kocurii]|uniref:DUF4260 domain-containing protein n=1 Tax=Halorubrum kocurii JCM 14978 TaxID=1230456 RepID=M0P1X7_9EURY|nr:DUF4260 domain-containing protein [Halorubrum kocurii]EMA62820.1 hypothetical protein C468_10542 [Halorubrum kocurii JCM 14978]
MRPELILRSEWAGLFGAATAAYFALGGPLWLFAVLALAPDVSMLAYLAGPRLGSSVYNAFHTSLAPLALGAAGAWLGATPLVWVALVWAAHVGADRAVGYGLKYPTGFKRSHLSPGTDRDASTADPGRAVPDAAATGKN